MNIFIEYFFHILALIESPLNLPAREANVCSTTPSQKRHELLQRKHNFKLVLQFLNSILKYYCNERNQEIESKSNTEHTDVVYET